MLQYMNTSSHFDGALSALIVVDAYNEVMTFNQLYEVVRAIEDRLSPDAHCVLGTRFIDSDEGSITVRILFQAVSPDP